MPFWSVGFCWLAYLQAAKRAACQDEQQAQTQDAKQSQALQPSPFGVEGRTNGSHDSPFKRGLPVVWQYGTTHNPPVPNQLKKSESELQIVDSFLPHHR